MSIPENTTDESENLMGKNCISKSLRSRGSTKESKYNHTNGTNGKNSEIKDRQSLVLWRSPLKTLSYFFLELKDLFIVALNLRNFIIVMGLLLVSVIFYLSVLYVLPEWQVTVLSDIWNKVLWYLWWIGLGILSSVGFGTGLHTFVLYLGPFIVQVTLAAYECNSLNFPSPPYPDDVVCPLDNSYTDVNVWKIMSKVRWEAICWGVGTAIGELPPYFMAKAARQSGQMDEEENEIIGSGKANFMDRAKIWIQDYVPKVGFFGILICASVPNPLFDLAGITCGHFLIPFHTFFGATLIGKAIIKMHIQQIFVIFIFSEHHVEQMVSLISYIPLIGSNLEVPFKEYLVRQKEKLHQTFGKGQIAKQSWLSWGFEKLVFGMIFYFIISIINSLAQKYHKKLCKEEKQKR